MKTLLRIMAVLGMVGPCWAASTTIDTNNAYAYGANVDWINAFADGTCGPKRAIFLAFLPVYEDNRAPAGSGQIATGEVL